MPRSWASTPRYKDYFSPPGGPQEKYHSLSETADKKIAIIKVEGADPRPRRLRQAADRPRQKDDDVVAVVLRIDSPGGTVTASDYLYHHLRELAEERELPIVVSMGGMCASGGYYLAMAAGDGRRRHLRRADDLDRLDRRGHSALRPLRPARTVGT